MEFPHLGEHCYLKSCNQLDFLPFKCSACEQVFCKDHFTFKNHSCVKASENDHQVPVCPICNVCVSFKYGDQPDINMNRHLDEECSVKNKSKIYKNRCSMISCRDKVMIEIICDGCKSNYCLKHRHADDHNCNKKYLNQKNLITARQTNASNSAASAAMQRLMNNGLNKTTNFVQRLSNNITNIVNTPNSTPLNQPHYKLSNQNRSNHQNVQGSLNEDEALAIAIQQSLNDQNKTSISFNSSNRGTQNNPIVLEDEDENLRRAIEESKREYERNKDKCSMS